MSADTRAVVTVHGQDCKGIIAAVSRVLYENGVNILDISQTVVSGQFSMILIADVSEAACSPEALAQKLNEAGHRLGLQITLQGGDLFETMHSE